MGGRGTGSTILGTIPVGGTIERKDGSWDTQVAVFNPLAGQREILDKEALFAFAEIAKREGTKDGKTGTVEFAAVLDNGYFTQVARGRDGSVTISKKMLEQADGKEITHYHNRPSATDQEIAEAEADDRTYKQLDDALMRYQVATYRYNLAEKQRKSAVNTIQRGGGRLDDTNPPSYLKDEYDKYHAALNEERLATRQKKRAENDFRERYKAYTKEEAPRKAEDFKMPEQKKMLRDQTGMKGGPFSWQDIDHDVVALGRPAFSATCDEGIYIIRTGSGVPKLNDDGTPILDANGNPEYKDAETELRLAKKEIKALFDPSIEKPKKSELPGIRQLDFDQPQHFQYTIGAIDRKTAKEGKEKGWSEQKTRAISVNRQLEYLWSVEQHILGKHGINATFIENPNYKPVFEED